MTDKRDFKSIVRDRQRKTGESYTTARSHVERERRRLLGLHDEPAAELPIRVDAAVLGIDATTATIRLLGTAEPIVLRARGVSRLAPGQIVTATIEKRWRGDGGEFASGRIEDARLDVPALGLVPLPLTGGELEDLSDHDEQPPDQDPYAPLWAETGSRAIYEMDEIAWGVFPGTDPDDNPTIEAVELKDQGELHGARRVLMEALARDLRCLDAHAHLGNFVFDRSPERALVHYEIGLRVGELSLPQPFDGVLPWSCLYNRPFLRCLHGYALCLWRVGRTDEARRTFERILALNPSDNQGARFCWYDVCQGLTWAEAQARDKLQARTQRRRATRAPAAPLRVPADDPDVN